MAFEEVDTAVCIAGMVGIVRTAVGLGVGCTFAKLWDGNLELLLNSIRFTVFRCPTEESWMSKDLVSATRNEEFYGQRVAAL
jgi:hypothetical protein